MGISAVAIIVTAIALTACGGGRSVVVPPGDAFTAPGFQPLPNDLADSPQLDALVPRETAGLEPTSASANGGLLPGALEALNSLDPAPTALSRLSIYNDSVYLSYLDRGIAGRSVSLVYRGPDDFSVSEPSFADSGTYPISAVDRDVPARLIDAIERRFPGTRVTSVDLDVGLSYDFGLVWYLDIEDARGMLATVFADLDGAIVAVDMG
jgi:hypothetical protein